MENQVRYHVGERPYHADYLQGKRPDQHIPVTTIFTYLAGAFFGLMFFIGLYTFGSWLWNLLTAAA